MIIPLFMLMGLHGILLQTLPITPLPWFGITFIVALLVIVVAAAIYMIAPLFGSSAMRQWSIFQVYEAVLSIALIVLFLGVGQILFLNPQTGFASVGLVPNGCTAATTIYMLSTCDLAQFNNASYSVAGYMWAFAFAKALIPATSFAIQPTPQEGVGLEITFQVPAISDAANTRIINTMLQFILAALLLSQVELILLSSSLLLLSFFFTIGLIARVFGISRSFGGAMIAFGIGLGIIYPLIVAITYGYIDVASNTYCLQLSSTTFIQTAAAQVGCWAGTGGAQAASGASASALSGTTFASALFNVMLPPFGSIATLFTNSGLQSLGSQFALVFQEIGYILAGLTVIPIINILIVDVFIVDFSKAVGERMSFSMLFRGIV
jgi:hypothetical protein